MQKTQWSMSWQLVDVAMTLAVGLAGFYGLKAPAYTMEEAANQINKHGAFGGQSIAE